jgi:hypothetical protein
VSGARLTPLAFAQRYLGATVGSVGGIGGECVDLANEWLAEAYCMAHVYRNAVDWGNRNLPGYNWVMNAPANAPSAGDLVVWGPDASVGTGVNGHIALALLGDSMHLLTLDQNWSGRFVTLELHTYRGVLGWQRKG